MAADPPAALPWSPVPRAVDGRRSVAGSGAARHASALSRVGVRGGAVAVVDPAGRVGLWEGTWALDWWIGADDRWHRPAHEVAVRQQRLHHAPVIETAVRIPSGDAVQRLFGLRLPDHGGDHLVVEIENRSPAPFALALVVGPGSRVDVSGRVARLDGQPALGAARPPSRVATGHDEDELFADLLGGRAIEGDEAAVDDPAGRAGAALLWPLPHTATLRILVPLAPVDQEPPVARGLAVAPPADQVARGWARQVDGRVRVELPDDTVASAVTTARTELLLGAGRVVDDPLTVLRALRAVDQWGHDDEAVSLLAVLADQAELADASRAGDQALARAALVMGLSAHQRLRPDAELAAAALETVAESIPVLDRAARGRRRRSADDLQLLAATALYDAADLLAAGGQLDAAAAVRRLARKRSVSVPPPAHLVDLVPGGARDAIWPDARRGALDGHGPAGSGAAGDPRRGGLADTVQLDTVRLETVRLELLAALAGFRQRDPGGWDRIRVAIGTASATGTWADPAVGPLLLVAVRAALLLESGEDAPARTAPGEGEHSSPGSRAPSESLALSPSPRLSVAPGWSPSWGRQPAASYRLPTTVGAVSWALRWHGDRPALLWELESSPSGASSATGGSTGSVEATEHVALGGPAVDAPAIDPAWRGSGPQGEALLAAPAFAAPVAAPLAAPRAVSGPDAGSTSDLTVTSAAVSASDATPVPSGAEPASGRDREDGRDGGAVDGRDGGDDGNGAGGGDGGTVTFS